MELHLMKLHLAARLAEYSDEGPRGRESGSPYVVSNVFDEWGYVLKTVRKTKRQRLSFKEKYEINKEVKADDSKDSTLT